MLEILISPDREEIKAKYRELIQSGAAPGMRPDMNAHLDTQRVIARAQLLFVAATTDLGQEVSYRSALRSAQNSKLGEPSRRVRE